MHVQGIDKWLTEGDGIGEEEADLPPRFINYGGFGRGGERMLAVRWLDRRCADEA